jgi:hypothetical protein
MGHLRSYGEFTWKGDKLTHLNSTRPAAELIRDTTYPTMWQFRLADGTLSDLFNRTRAKNNAIVASLSDWNAVQRAHQPPLVSVTPATGITLGSSL